MNGQNISITSISDFNSICRVCLTEKDNLQFIWEVYLHNEEQNKQLNISELFKQYCNIKIIPTEDKPQKICNDCTLQFLKSYCFFEKVSWSNGILDVFLEEKILYRNSGGEDSKLYKVINDEADESEQFSEFRENIITKSSSKNTSDNYRASSTDYNDQNEADVFENDYQSSVSEAPNLDNEETGPSSVTVKNNGNNFENDNQSKTNAICVETETSEVEPTIEKMDRIKTKPSSSTGIENIPDYELLIDELRIVVPKEKSNTSVEELKNYGTSGKRKCQFALVPSKTVATDEPQEQITNDLKLEQALYECRFCLEPLRKIKDTIDHYDEYHAFEFDDHVKCIICDTTTTFNQRDILLFHMALHFPDSIKCIPCRKYFSNKNMLTEHRKQCFHGYGLGMKSDLYTETHATELALQNHMMYTQPTNENGALSLNPLDSKQTTTSVQCEFCGELFCSKIGYGRHIRRHPEFKQYKCKICSFNGDTREELNAHREEKHNKLTCEECGKRFPFASELKAHHKKHNELPVWKYSCNVCGKTAQSPRQLEVHYRIHTGERPFPCETCGKSFRQIGHLRIHMYQHTGQKPFKCLVCEKAFPYLTLMEIHMRTHTGERPFVCRYCGNTYHDQITMNKHQKKKHPGMPLQKIGRREPRVTKIL